MSKKAIAAVAVASMVAVPTVTSAAQVIPEPEAQAVAVEKAAETRTVAFRVVDANMKVLDVKTGVFEVLDSKGVVVASFDMSKAGAKEFVGNVGETYTIKVKALPEGYSKISETKEVTVATGTAAQIADFPVAEGKIAMNDLSVEMTLGGKIATEGTVKVTELGKKDPVATFDFSKQGAKTCKVQAGKTYVLVAKGPAGYMAENSPRRLVVKHDGQPIVEKFNLVPEVKRTLEVKHLDVDTKEPLKGGKFNIMEKDTQDVIGFIDFAQNKNTAELLAGKTYTIVPAEQMQGYKTVKGSFEVEMKANEAGKTENQILVIESKKVDAKADAEVKATKTLDARHVDKLTNKELKEGVITITEVDPNPSAKAQDPNTVKDPNTKAEAKPEAQTYDFAKTSKENNVTLENGKTYEIEFTAFAKGYTPETVKQTVKMDFGTNGADTHVMTFYSVIGGSPNTGDSETALPKTGAVAASSTALITALGSGLGIIRRFFKE